MPSRDAGAPGIGPPGRSLLFEFERDLPGAHALARGELSEEDARELKQLKALIEARSGFSCDAYKERCLRRRLAVRMRARAVHRYADYAALLERDEEELERFLAIVTINVSKFFRNAEVWETFRREVVPELFALNEPEVRILSAGCASGEEPYSVAITLLEYARAHGLEARLRRFRILGIDIDREILAAARRAEYGALALDETPPEVRARWFEAGPKYRLREEVKRLVQFRPLDLLNDPLPSGQHVILCRNVTIYFKREFQEALLQRMHEALNPGGFLILGKVETLIGPHSRSFVAIANRERIFRKG
jgi:chemotaxis protein methyltransferase CheR